jgi:lysozyme family protein
MDADARYARCEALVLRSEGGYVDNRLDRGGPTNKGITLETLSGFLGRAASVAELEHIGDELVAAIYRHEYWGPIAGDALPAGVDYIVFDEAVNQGAARAARQLQAAAGCAEDGAIGRVTLAHVTACDPVSLVQAVRREREAAYRAAPAAQWAEFGRGWINRLDAVEAQAIAWAKGGA